MKVSKEQLKEVDRVAQIFEKNLEEPLTQEVMEEMDRKVTKVLADLGHYRRFFKRLA